MKGNHSEQGFIWAQDPLGNLHGPVAVMLCTHPVMRNKFATAFRISIIDITYGKLLMFRFFWKKTLFFRPFNRMAGILSLLFCNSTFHTPVVHRIPLLIPFCPPHTPNPSPTLTPPTSYPSPLPPLPHLDWGYPSPCQLIPLVSHHSAPPPVGGGIHCTITTHTTAGVSSQKSLHPGKSHRFKIHWEVISTGDHQYIIGYCMRTARSGRIFFYRVMDVLGSF